MTNPGRFNGRWDPSNKYTNYVGDGVLINTESNFATLASIIATQLSIDTSTSNRVNWLWIMWEVDELEELAPCIIVNPNHSLFEKDQVYKNKYVLTSALKRHSILKHFQFKTTRSSSIVRSKFKSL
ncbi:hypothetical protein H5410_047903 [Solanum commersonii]|uniref:Uncharacterized protein n=1 Tax=Solanum commersonii TaxID=4109 RepID=A0A9J5XIA6_SOLCO|nr:hypothetical protein H5410_047903 [Solanum commersonii]